MLPHEYLDGLYHLRNQEQAEILESIGRAAQRETALTASRVADHISQLREERWPLLEAIDSEIERMTGYCSSFRYKFWLESHSLRGLIWIIAITVSIATYFDGAIELYGGDLPGYIIFMGLISILSFIWAVWSSVIPDYQPKA